jgi:hypothetical protein
MAESLDSAAQKPISVSVDGRTVTHQSFADQIALDKYLAEKAAATAGNTARFGLRFAKIQPPGADT